MLLLSLIEASQSAVESSDLALKAAVEALTAAQTANSQAKDVLKTVSEAFVQEDRKMMAILEGKQGPALWVESDFEFAPCDLGTSRDLKISINYERYMM